jgi:hypothetical protein
MRTSRISRYLLAAALLLCLAAPAARAAEEPHVFDEALSLTGDCSTGTLDMVPDPGCPGGVHPSEAFASPSSIATDPHGDIYVASRGTPTACCGFDPVQGHVDVFDPGGHFLAELAVPGAKQIAVDAGGRLYVSASFCLFGTECYDPSRYLLRFDPTKYAPGTGEIAYGNPPVKLPVAHNSEGPIPPVGIAINPSNQHVFASYGGEYSKIWEYGPTVDGEPNEVLDEDVASINRPGALAVDAAHGLLYATDSTAEDNGEAVVRAFELAPPHDLVRTLDGSTSGGFSDGRVDLISLAAEEASGDLFIGDVPGNSRVYEVEEDGTLAHTYKHGFVGEAIIYVDNSPESPNQGYLFVPSGVALPGHAFAFAPPAPDPQPPVVEAVSASGVGEREALLEAIINPEGLTTSYTVEYTTQAAFEEHGFEGAVTAGGGTLAPAISGRHVAVPVAGLSAGTAYRFRVEAENECQPGGCADQAEGSFTTYSSPLQGGSCENQALRTGPSAALPDCRAYELVTPADTNGVAPQAPGARYSVYSGGFYAGVPTVRADGEAIPFATGGGSLAGMNTAGGLGGDIYLATRTPSGWQIASETPTGEESPSSEAGPLAMSPDLSAVAWVFGAPLGSPGSEVPVYLRAPDGGLQLIGEGPLATVKRVDLKYVGTGGAHTIFQTQVPLVEGAPAAPAQVVYDRTPDGVLHIVSLLPGEVVPSGGASYSGSSPDGSAVAFRIDSEAPLYVRLDNSRTIVASPAGGAYVGFSDDGRYLFYINEGGFFRFDIETEETGEIAATGLGAEPVNVASRGTGAYFVSEARLGEANPLGEEADEGQPNLYHWDGEATHFVATLSAEDMEGKLGEDGFEGGFEEWMLHAGSRLLDRDPTRSSAEGSTLVFRSRTQLTDYDPEGHAEVYRYDADEDALACISCNPTGAAAASDAGLMTLDGPLHGENGDAGASLAANLSADGTRAFFETSDRLLAADNDGTQDVYEWEAEGKGSCRQPGGCVFLISSGNSARPNFFYGADPEGRDVAIVTADLLSPEDGDETLSIYDARVGGGFPAAGAGAGECLGEACQPAARAAADPPVSLQGARNVPASKGRKCPKGKRLAKKAGKRRCVPRGRHHRKANKGKGGRR